LLSPTPSLTSTVVGQGPSKSVFFPNPLTTGNTDTLQVQLTTASNVRVRFYTVSFRKVLDKTFTNVPAGTDDLVIHLDQGGTLANGLYHVVVDIGGTRSVLKLLIER
jgi:hypothetical protein